MSGTLDSQDPPILMMEKPTGVAGSSRPVVAGWELVRDIAMLLTWIVAADWLLYQVGTYFAWGLFLLGAVLLLWAAKWRTLALQGGVATAAWLVFMACKLIWCGSPLQIPCALFLGLCYAMALNGLPPFLPEVISFLVTMFIGAVKRCGSFRLGRVSEATGAFKPALGAPFLIPLSVVCVFGTLFILANPNLAENVGLQLRLFFDGLLGFVKRFGVGEAFLWIISGIFFLGLLYPVRAWRLAEPRPSELEHEPSPAPLFLAYRNTLLSVIALYVSYLVFEFSTLWFREFPANFYYAGYAHAGAFWLTVALAVATLVLSAIFQGSTLSDARLGRLKRLALIWSALNLVLSVAVYHRLLIYIDFNGLTRMRIVGLLGITSVVVGFWLVVCKLWRDHGLVWLLHRQLWVPVGATLAFIILPVDWIAHRFNAGQVSSGNLAPSVQIVAQESAVEGGLPLIALLDCDNVIIRDGIRAMLALWSQKLLREQQTMSHQEVRQGYAAAWRSELGHSSPWLESSRGQSFRSESFALPRPPTWQNFQIAEYLMRKELSNCQAKWQPYALDSQRRDEAINAFFKYAYQWY